MNDLSAHAYIKEIGNISSSLQDDYTDLRLALHYRNIWYARLSEISVEVDRAYYNKLAEITEEYDAKAERPSERLSEWKATALMSRTIEGRLYELKKRVMKTIEKQCDFIQTELIEVQSDRKYSGYQQTANR